MSAPDSTQNRSRLFVVAFAAIVATSFCFVLRAMVVDEWGVEFALTQTQKGELLGVGLWPFSITIVLLSLFIDRIGFRAVLWLAALCHAAGLALLLSAQGYWALYIGTLVMALGNGAVEAAANPLVATLFREDKSRWLNRVHAAWPGGLIAGGLLAMALGAHCPWRWKVALMIVPVAVYAGLLLRQQFPVGERVAFGVSYRAMLAEGGFMSAFVIIALMMLEVGRVFALPLALTAAVIGALTAWYAVHARSAGRPLYLVFVLLMIPLATTELSTDSWITSLMTPQMHALGLGAGWVLVYTAALAFVIRIFAGSIIHAFKPLWVLAGAAAAAAAGLSLMSNATGLAILGAATLYGIGKSFFWGTSLGVVSERFPKGGALALNLIAGAGMLAAGILGSELLGAAQDAATVRAVVQYDAKEHTNLAQRYLSAEKTGLLGGYRALDHDAAAHADAKDAALLASFAEEGKKGALADVALLPAVMLVVYLLLVAYFRTQGGYRPVDLGARPTETASSS